MDYSEIDKEMEARIAEKASILNNYTGLANKAREDAEKKILSWNKKIDAKKLEYIKELDKFNDLDEDSRQESLEGVMKDFDRRESILLEYEQQLETMSDELSKEMVTLDGKQKDLDIVEEKLRDTIIDIISLKEKRLTAGQRAVKQQLETIKNMNLLIKRREERVKDMERSIKSAKNELGLSHITNGK